MARELTVRVEELNDEAFALYGQIIRAPNVASGRSGSGWQAWDGFSALDCRQTLIFGSVLTERRDIVVDVLERHAHTFEWLLLHDREIIQSVTPPDAVCHPDALPDPTRIRPFGIPVGVAIVMHAGTWHSPAFSASDTCRDTVAALEPDFDYVPERVEFAEGVVVRIGG